MSRYFKRKGKTLPRATKPKIRLHKDLKREDDYDESEAVEVEEINELSATLSIHSDDQIDLPTEILSYFVDEYHLDPHSTDCFTFPDEYVLANNFFKKFAHKFSKIKLSWVSQEDVSLPYRQTVYQLGPHNTDSFTEEDEYVGVRRYEARLLAEAMPEEKIHQICSLKQLEEYAESLLEFITFSEHLIMLSTNGDEVGEMSIIIRLDEHEYQNCAKIVLESSGIIQNCVTCTRTTGYVAIPTLETIKCFHHEFIESHSGVQNEQTILTKTDENYTLKHIQSSDKGLNTEHLTFTLQEMEAFVSDVSCILIQRIFILTSKPDEEYKFHTFNTECQLCPIHFRSLSAPRQVVCGNTISVLGINKELHWSQEIYQDHIYFNGSGRILSHYPIGMPVVLRAEEIIAERKLIKKETLKNRKEIDWQNDWELWSKFHTRKESLCADYSAYAKRNPDLQAILVDFLQAVLINRPKDVISYACQYFSAFK